MEIKLKKLILENFKGIKHFELIANENDVAIYGDNATGKTTIADAFYWLLFNKDSKGDTKFSIKTLDNSGNEINNLNHSVYAVLVIDGVEHHIKKTYFEKWTQKRGQATKNFTGHQTNYEIGSSERELTPKKLKEFNDYISSIIADEQIFKLTTNPMTFNSLKTNERKDILMSLVEEVTDEDVINSNKDLEVLKKRLGDGSLEDFKKRITRDKKAINEQLTAIPVRIDEINHNMPDVQRLDEQKIKGEIDELTRDTDKIHEELVDIKNGVKQAELEAEIKKKQIDLQMIMDNADGSNKRKLEGLQEDLKRSKKQLEDYKYDLTVIDKKIERNNQDKENLTSHYKGLVAEYNELNSEEKTFETKTVCECCGQDIPEHMQQEAIEKMQSQYNLNKSRRLEELALKINEAKENAVLIKETSEREESAKQSTAEMIGNQERIITGLESDVQKLLEDKVDVTETKEYQALSAEIEELKKKKLVTLTEMDELIADKNENELKPLESQINHLKHYLDEIEISRKAVARIKELEKKQNELAQQYEELEHSVYLTEEFTKSKVALMEDTINSKFKHAKFKLFDVQINGGINDVCEATYKGVPFDSGLNNAGRINIGLDIINTLSEHYNFYAPIMVDNAESVTQIEPTESQQIKLVVSEQDKKLRVEEK